MLKSYFFKHLSCTLSALSNFKPKSQYYNCWTKASTTKPFSVTMKKPSSSSSSSCSNAGFCASQPLDTTTLSASASASAAAESSAAAYLSVSIRCPRHAADMLSEALLCFGASSASMDEDEEEEEEDGGDSSSESCIESVFLECQDVDLCLSQAADSIGLKEIPPYQVKREEQYDWIKKAEESFHPVEVTEGLWIVPEWRSPPDAKATNIILNPGLAFGTGEHPTTKLCLVLLKHLIKGGEIVLDYGTGSGILAIAALKFGAVRSVGFDIDPQAIASASHNAVLNKIGPEEMELQLVPEKTFSSSMDQRTDEEQSNYATGVISGREKYDVVIANLLANPLLELADDIVSYAKAGAVIGISGILSEQVPCIMDRYSVLLEDVSVSEMDHWACVCGRKGK